MIQSRTQSWHWLIRFAAAIAIPAIPCFAYYSRAYVEDAGVLLEAMVVLAGPLALIGASGLIWGLLAPRRSKVLLWLAATGLVLSTALLFCIRV